MASAQFEQDIRAGKPRLSIQLGFHQSVLKLGRELPTSVALFKTLKLKPSQLALRPEALDMPAACCLAGDQQPGRALIRVNNRPSH